MANLLGDLWGDREPDWLSLCSRPEVKLHLYGKLEPRPGRKMGHLCAMAADTDTALKTVLEGRECLVQLPKRPSACGGVSGCEKLTAN